MIPRYPWLKARTHEMYADIGMIAIEKYGAEDFGAIGENYKELQTQITALQERKTELIREHEEALRAAEEARKGRGSSQSRRSPPGRGSSQG